MTLILSDQWLTFSHSLSLGCCFSERTLYTGPRPNQHRIQLIMRARILSRRLCLSAHTHSPNLRLWPLRVTSFSRARKVKGHSESTPVPFKANKNWGSSLTIHLYMCVYMYNGPKKWGQLRHTSKHVNDTALVRLLTHKKISQKYQTIHILAFRTLCDPRLLLLTKTIKTFFFFFIKWSWNKLKYNYEKLNLNENWNLLKT